MRQETEGNLQLLEEAKADISGLFALQYLIDKGVLPQSLERTLYTTFLASAFRSIRFGVNEAHGRGHRDPAELPARSGWVRRSKPDGTFAVNPAKIKEGVTGLTRDIMTIQAEGDYAKAKALGDRLGVVRPVVQKALDKLTAVPVDIEPRFTTATQLLSQNSALLKSPVAQARPASGQ